MSADVYARYCRLKGDDVTFVSGSDEHGTPIEIEAVRLGILPKQLTDRNHARVSELLRKWGISLDNYTRTENPVHIEFVRDHLMRIYNNGFIIPQETEMLHCEFCGRFLPDRFVEGKCPKCGSEGARGDQCDTCGRLLETTSLVEPYCVICKGKPVLKKTKHWYFDIPKLSEKLIDYLDSNRQMTSSTRNFSLSLVREGLKPRAVTRDVSKTVQWGIPAPFPDAENKTIYVWVEAVLGYISATIEHFRNQQEPERWKEFWFDKDVRSLYCIGKDNIPFHTIIFPALLLASGIDYNLPWNVAATEFLQFKDEKFSKSHRIGIFIDEALELFPADYWRFYLLSTRPEAKDTNFTWELFTEKINADLNDTYGNFIHRTLTFIDKQFGGKAPPHNTLDDDAKRILDSVKEKVDNIAKEIEECKLQTATNTLISIARIGNQYLNEKEPWNLIQKDKTQTESVLYVAMQIVKTLSIVSYPFIPFAANELWKTLRLERYVHEQGWTHALDSIPTGHKIDKPHPLFRKVEEKTQELDERLEKTREAISKTL